VNFELPLMAVDEMAECLLVSAARTGDEIGLHTRVDVAGRGNRALRAVRI